MASRFRHQEVSWIGHGPAAASSVGTQSMLMETCAVVWPAECESAGIIAGMRNPPSSSSVFSP